MNASPELGEQTPRRLPTQLPPVLHYRPGKEAVPNNADVIRQHPPLYAGDFNKRKDAYYWEIFDRNKPENERLRLALHYGEERSPRCDLCEKEDRACVSSLGKRSKTTGCARCIRRHYQCSQANGIQKSASKVQKNTDRPFKPNSHARKRALDKTDDRETTEPPAKRTRASMNGKSFESHELFAHDDDDEYHTPLESRRGSVYTLDISLHGSADSYRASPDLRQAKDDQMVGDESRRDVGGTVDLARPSSSISRTGRHMSSAARSVPEDQNQANDQATEVQQNSAINAGSNSFGDLSRYFSNHEKLVLDLQSANATLTERVGQLESSRSSWQDVQTRLVVLESMSTPQQQGMQQGIYPASVRALELRILELEKAKAGLGDRGIGADIRRLERMIEGERGERRKQVDSLQKVTKSLKDEVAVLSSENEGLRGRLNKLIMGQVRNLRD
ncbi:hypothetical protein E4T50_11655 [Aureobasidium sp. EXF-12298]|nr:hypothetical protein E4T50_11655 [Aureobasidium sp. EXF-12298]